MINGTETIGCIKCNSKILENGLCVGIRSDCLKYEIRIEKNIPIGKCLSCIYNYEIVNYSYRYYFCREYQLKDCLQATEINGEKRKYFLPGKNMFSL